MAHQFFITTLYFMPGVGYIAPYMYQYPSGAVLIVEVCYDPRRYAAREIRLRMPPGMIEVTPEMLRKEENK